MGIIEERINRYAESCGFSFTQITGESRAASVSLARQIIWKRLRDFNYTYDEIAITFSRVRGGVIYGVQRVNDLLLVKDNLTYDYLNKILSADYERQKSDPNFLGEL